MNIEKIIVEGKAANKSLRIYRPDISLDEICKTNGAGIVRAMVPCFSENPRFSYIYGVNARTPRVNRILPFSNVYQYKKESGEGKFLDQFKPEKEIKLTVPAFTDKYHIRELLLHAKIQDGCITPSDVDIKEIIIDENLDDKKVQLCEDICNPDAFLTIQANELGLDGDIYMWLTSEDYNVNTAGEALSNIIAITDNFDAINNCIKPRRLDFINLLFLIKARYMFDTEIAQRKTAIASAKAAIMSRNMSHNLGSHVMAYLKQHLNSVQDMVRDNVLDSVLKSGEDLTTLEGIKKWNDRCQSIIKEKKDGLSEVALPFLVGLGKFISYLQERQDFIATIATNYIPYFSTVNFKDFVYDELNPDLRYERHKDRSGLQPDNILLGNIARSEGLARKTNPTMNKEMSDIVLKYRHFDGKSVNDDLGHPLTTADVPDIEDKVRDLDDMRTFMVQLPGGVVGRQAIFSIVENVIRNAAKHGKWGEGKNKSLELTFDRYYLEDIEEGKIPNDYVPEGEETINDFLKRYYGHAMDRNDICIVTLTDNMSFEKNGTPKDKCEHLASIRKALIEPYIDNSTVEMLQTNKGIKEMRISAAWMRGIEDDVKINPLYITPDFDFDKLSETEKEKKKEDHWIHVRPKSPKDEDGFVYKYWDCPNRENWDSKKAYWVGKAPVFMVRACAQTPKEDYHLQYIFCLPKPQEAAIILSSETWEAWKKRDQNSLALMRKKLSTLSWGVFDTDSYLKTLNKSYEFIIVEDVISLSQKDQIRMVSPNRVFCQTEVKSILDIDREIINGSVEAITSELLKNKKVEFFRLLSDFDPKETITISDAKTLARVPLLKEKKSDNVIVGDGIAKAPYLYRTHNETELLFSDYMEATENYKDACFVEGITGNNSTDRLVRNDILDDQWLYSHLHAMKTTVGVFDERIFSRIYKKDEADIIAPKSLDNIQNEYLEKLYDQNEEDPRLEKIAQAESVKEIEEILNEDLTTVYGNYMAIAYEKKGVSIFNIIKTDDGLDIYGYSNPPQKEITNSEDEKGTKIRRVKYSARIEKLAEIKKVKNHIKIIKHKPIKKFDYLTIHQGLLDKIYEQFDIRRKPYEKHLFTKLFYETFCSHDKIIEYKDELIPEGNVFYLPNLRIHSGRSKPSFADMPQHQPFMQYSAIEHAIMDCKYSLIELLDFARYEDDKSNDDL